MMNGKEDDAAAASASTKQPSLSSLHPSALLQPQQHHHHHARSRSEPPPSQLLLKQSLVRLPMGSATAAAAAAVAQQDALSLSNAAGETQLMMDQDGNLRDELGFLINNNTPLLGDGPTVSSAPVESSPVLFSSSSMAAAFAASISISNITSISSSGMGQAQQLQRKAWDDFYAGIGGEAICTALSPAELQRWHKPDPTPPTTAPTTTAPTTSTRKRTRIRRRWMLLLFSSSSSAPPAAPPPVVPSSSSSSRRQQLTQLIRTYGVPTELRSQIWFACSGAHDKQRHAKPEEQYDALLLSALAASSSSSSAQIERDLHRTFPTNYLYQKDEGIASLRHVLLAYSLRNPEVGYCQSMNFIVATLLLHMTETEAFWVLASIVEDLVPGYFASDLWGVHVDQWVFAALVKSRFPRLAAHLDRLDQQLLTIVTYQWFLCLFVNSLPLGTALRTWDSFLHEGSKVLFRVGLTIIRTLSRDLWQCESFSEAYEVLTTGPKDRRRFSGQALMRGAFDSLYFAGFSSRMLAELRHQKMAKRSEAAAAALEAASAAAAAVVVKKEEEEDKRDARAFSWEFSPPPAAATSRLSVVSTGGEASVVSVGEEEEQQEEEQQERSGSSEGTIWEEDNEDEEEEEVPRPSQLGQSPSSPQVVTANQEESAASAVGVGAPTVELPSEYLTRLPGLRFVLSAKPSSSYPSVDTLVGAVGADTSLQLTANTSRSSSPPLLLHDSPGKSTTTSFLAAQPDEQEMEHIRKSILSKFGSTEDGGASSSRGGLLPSPSAAGGAMGVTPSSFPSLSQLQSVHESEWDEDDEEEVRAVAAVAQIQPPRRRRWMLLLASCAAAPPPPPANGSSKL